VSAAPLPTSPSPDLTIVELGPGDELLLQRFFEANPAYFDAVFGEPAGPEAARDEIRELPPDGWSYTRRWLLGYRAADGELAAVADVVSDLLVPGAWHVGLFIVATARHGSGEAARLYRGLEAWAAGHGARWLRLGVVQGNARAERFWAAQGFVETRTRTGVVMSPPGRPKGEYRSAQHEGTPVSPPGRPKGEYRSAQHEGTPVSPPGRPEGEYRSAQHEGTPLSRRTNTLRVLVKALAGESLAAYLALVPRDRPGCPD
jgi:GNAT superfamily N-acetyltransferase